MYRSDGFYCDKSLLKLKDETVAKVILVSYDGSTRIWGRNNFLANINTKPCEMPILHDLSFVLHRIERKRQLVISKSQQPDHDTRNPLKSSHPPLNP